MNNNLRYLSLAILMLALLACGGKSSEQIATELKSLDLSRGDIALCGSGMDQFGTVVFSQSCSESVRADFNLAAALLHSFEYAEAEKAFAKVMDADPTCVMAYWGAAMSNFHPLWEPPNQNELQKGARIVALARTLVKDKDSRESAYIEAIATIFDQWETLDHRTRLGKFVTATEKIYTTFPDDDEAAVFYSLALRASADPADKSFANQKKAGIILDGILAKRPNHPGTTHYIIHNYDYPELADLALPAARKYASIAAASAHAQHMPSHIFTRLGLWDESIKSNISSITAAECYAQNLGIKGHLDEELHGMDYLMYAYLQEGNEARARELDDLFKTIEAVFPENFKGAYSFAAIPTRFALERKDWAQAELLQFSPANFPWDKFPWERANLHLGRLLGHVHTGNVTAAREDLNQLRTSHAALVDAKESYRANLVKIQTMTGEAWINLVEGKKQEAITLMTAAADMEDATEKHSVTPGEVIPARELLGDMYLQMGDAGKALEAYEVNLKKHPNRFNGLAGAGMAARKSGDMTKAKLYFAQLLAVSSPDSNREELAVAALVIGASQ